MAPVRAGIQTPPGSSFVATYDSATGTASIDIDTPGDDTKTWRLKFAAPPGQQLGVGAYPNAIRWPFNGAGQPGFSLVRLYQGCNEESGGFTISDWQVDGPAITALAVSFSHECETGINGTSRGELRVGSTLGLKAVLPYVGVLDFGETVTGHPTPSMTLTLAARGNIASTITGTTFAGTDPGEFEKMSDTCTGTTLAPGSTCAVKVRLTAMEVGPRSAKLVVTDDTFPATHQIALTSAWAAPYAFGPTSIDFGSQLLLTRARKMITVTAGLKAVTVGPFEIQGGPEGYVVDRTPCATVKALATCSFPVVFRPTVAGAHTGSISGAFSADNAPFNFVSIPLAGVGAITSSVAWGTDRTAGRDKTWSYGKGLGRTVSGTTTYLHAIETTDYIGGKWATNTSPKVGVYYVRTSNSGATWTASLRLNPSTQHAERGAMTAAGSNVYAAWVSQTKWIGYDPKAPRVLYVRANTNHGSTTAWRTAVRVSSATGRVDYPAIAASGNSVYVAYTDADTGNVRLATSRDRGATWTYRTLGTGTYQTSGSNGRAAYPSIAVSGTRVIVTWTLNADFKIVARTSIDGGATWSTQATMANVAGSESSAAATADRFVVGWTVATGAQVRTHKAGAWGSIRSISPGPSTAYPAHWTPAVAAVGTNGTAIVWAACESACDRSGSTVDLVWAESSDGGSTFPHLQIVAYVNQHTNWSPSVVWAKADARHVLYEQYVSEEAYRVRIRTGTGAPK